MWLATYHPIVSLRYWGDNRASLCLYRPNFIPSPLLTYSRSARWSPISNLWAFSIHFVHLHGMLALHATSLPQYCALSLYTSLKNGFGLFPPTGMKTLHPVLFSMKFLKGRRLSVVKTTIFNKTTLRYQVESTRRAGNDIMNKTKSVRCSWTNW